MICQFLATSCWGSCPKLLIKSVAWDSLKLFNSKSDTSALRWRPAGHFVRHTRNNFCNHINRGGHWLLFGVQSQRPSNFLNVCQRPESKSIQMSGKKNPNVKRSPKSFFVCWPEHVWCRAIPFEKVMSDTPLLALTQWFSFCSTIFRYIPISDQGCEA